MAHLNKEQYARRSENAAKRMEANAAIPTLSEEQHEALANLCNARHNLHCDMEAAAKTNENGLLQEIQEANIYLHNAKLPPIPGIGTDDDDFIDIDSISELIEIENRDTSSDDHEKWVYEKLEAICDQLEELNTTIEKYLASIDQKYGTSYAPTGALRIF